MSVQQKLIECEKSLIHSPVDKIEVHLDSQIKKMLDSIIGNEMPNKEVMITPPASSNSSELIDDNNNTFPSIASSANRANIESLVTR